VVGRGLSAVDEDIHESNRDDENVHMRDDDGGTGAEAGCRKWGRFLCGSRFPTWRQVSNYWRCANGTEVLGDDADIGGPSGA